jgi:hypothetical protein
MKSRMDKRQKFYRVYNNLPLNFREEVIVVVSGEPITWKVAKLEIDSETKIGDEILNKLDFLKII